MCGPVIIAVRGVSAPARCISLNISPFAKLVPTKLSMGGWCASSTPSRRSSDTVTPARAESMDS